MHSFITYLQSRICLILPNWLSATVQFIKNETYNCLHLCLQELYLDDTVELWLCTQQ